MTGSSDEVTLSPVEQSLYKQIHKHKHTKHGRHQRGAAELYPSSFPCCPPDLST